MFEPEDIEAKIVKHMKTLKSRYHVMAKVDLKWAEFGTGPANTLGASSSNNT